MYDTANQLEKSGMKKNVERIYHQWRLVSKFYHMF